MRAILRDNISRLSSWLRSIYRGNAPDRNILDVPHAEQLQDLNRAQHAIRDIWLIR